MTTKRQWGFCGALWRLGHRGRPQLPVANRRSARENRRRWLRVAPTKKGPPDRAALNCSPQGKEISPLKVETGAGVEQLEIVQRRRDVGKIRVDQVDVGIEVLIDGVEV